MAPLPRERRIATRREIGHLLNGSRARNRALDLFWQPAALSSSRAGCITPRFGHTVVERNRLRRRLKELMRQIFLVEPTGDEPLAGFDLLVRARPAAYGLAFAELERALRELAEQAAA